MKLSEAEALRVLDDHDRGVRNIDADFDHCCRNQNLNLAFLKQAHDSFFQVGIHAAVQHCDAEVGKNFLAQLAVHLHGGLEFVVFTLLNHGTDNVGLMSGCDVLADKMPDFVGALVADSFGHDRSSSGRHFVQRAEIEIAVEGEG